MFVDFKGFDEEVCVRLPIHDPKHNRNWTSEHYGTFDEIVRAGCRSAWLMDEAGFIPGWRETGEDAGPMDYVVFVMEAIDRVRQKWMS